MKTRQQILKEVYEHVRAHYGIHTQTDFAAALRISRPALSSAMNGNKAYLTENLFQKICAAFPGVFNLDCLLTGEGSIIADKQSSDVVEKTSTSQTYEMTADILEMYARMIRGIDDLRIQLKEELAEIKSIKPELQQARDDFRDAIYRINIALDRLNNNQSYNIGMAAEPNVSK